MAENRLPTMSKFLGDASDEVPEAVYRFFAREIKNQLFDRIVDHLRTEYHRQAKTAHTEAEKDKLKRRKDFLEFASSTAGTLILPFVFDFIVASVLELVPVGHDIRRRLAYNLRVLAYEDFGHQAFEAIGLGVDDFVLLKNKFDGTVQDMAAKLQAFENKLS